MNLHEQIVHEFNAYLKEAELFDEKDVKAAAVRARKALLPCRSWTRPTP